MKSVSITNRGCVSTWLRFWLDQDMFMSEVDRPPTLTRRLVNCPFSGLGRAPRPPFYGPAPARFGPEGVFTKPRFAKGRFVHPRFLGFFRPFWASWGVLVATAGSASRFWPKRTPGWVPGSIFDSRSRRSVFSCFSLISASGGRFRFPGPSNTVPG